MKDNVTNLFRFPSKTDAYYKTINITSLLDTTLSWKAKGLHVYLLTRPENWKVYMQDLFNRSEDGERSVREGIKELMAKSYIYQVKYQLNGRFNWTFLVYSEPTVCPTPKEIKELLCSEKQHVQNAHVVFVTLSINNKLLDKEEISKDISLSDSNESQIETPVIEERIKRTTPTSIKAKLIAQKGEPKIPKTIVKNNYVEYWNSLPNAVKHAPGTLAYKSAAKNIKDLLSGDFKLRSFDLDFLAKCSYDLEMDVPSFSRTEILNGLQRLSLLLTPGYWPENKNSYRSMGLSKLIYNPTTGKSMFLHVLANPPKLLSDMLSCNSQFKSIAEKFCMDNKLTELNKAVKFMDEIAVRFKKIPENAFEQGDFGYFCPTVEKFIEHFAFTYLNRQSWIKQMSVNFLDPKGTVFAAYVKKTWHYNTSSAGSLDKFLL
jgi:hypothetical protein